MGFSLFLGCWQCLERFVFQARHLHSSLKQLVCVLCGVVAVVVFAMDLLAYVKL